MSPGSRRESGFLCPSTSQPRSVFGKPIAFAFAALTLAIRFSHMNSNWGLHAYMSWSNRLLSGALTVVLSTAVALNATAREKEIPTAKPEKVGMSSERLSRLTQGMKQITDQGRLAGTVTCGTSGKVVHLEASGKRDVAPTRRCKPTPSSVFIP